MDKKLLSKHEFELRWVDLDAYNHLNNAKYYDFMTECRARDFWEFVNECGFIVRENSCNFKSPANYPATIVVEHYVHTISTSAFELDYIFYVKGSDKPFAQGSAKMVCFDLSKNRPARMPEKLKLSFENIK